MQWRQLDGIVWRKTRVDTAHDDAILTVLGEARCPLTAKDIGARVGVRSVTAVRRSLRRLKAAGAVEQIACRECGQTEYVLRSP